MRQRLAALWSHLRTEHTAPGRLAAAVFVGINLGLWPIYGIQTPICLLVAWALRLNKLTVVVAANISNPLFAPLLVSAGIVLGEWLRFGRLRPLDWQTGASFLTNLSLFAGEIPDLYASCFLGDAVIGLVLGAALAGVAYRVASRRGPSGADAGRELAEPPRHAP